MPEGHRVHAIVYLYGKIQEKFFNLDIMQYLFFFVILND